MSLRKLPASPRITADRTVHDALRDVATTVNKLVDLLNQGDGLPEYANDAAAATGGVELYGLYRTGSAIKQRVA